MQNPNEDTQWNDVLRAKGIIPAKEKETEISEDDIVNMVESTVQEKAQGKQMDEMNLDELNELEDEINEDDERVFEEYRHQRMMEMQAKQAAAKFGDVIEISKADWVTQVNQAGEELFVVVHIYKNSIPLCKLINQHLSVLARKFPATKFVKGVCDVCIPNYPDKNLPTLFIYNNGDMKAQMVGPLPFGGMTLTCQELEWIISEKGAIKTDLEENPRKQINDVMSSAIRQSNQGDDDDDID